MLKNAFLAVALIGAGSLSLTASPASAAPFRVLQQTIAQESVSNTLLVEINHRRDHRNLRRYWDARRDGNRCRVRGGNCRHYYRGYYYSSPWWTLPLVGAAIVLSTPGRIVVGGGGSAHVRWCRNQYRSYVARTNTWVSYSGEVRQCRSPYR